MTSPNEKLPSWATDSTFASGIESGYSTRLEPSAAEKGQGVKPGRWAARKANWILGSLSDWVSHMAKGQVRSWRKMQEGLVLGSTNLELNPTAGHISGGAWYLPAYSDSSGEGYLLAYPGPTSRTGQVSIASLIPIGLGTKATSVASGTSAIVVGLYVEGGIADTIVGVMSKNASTLTSKTLRSGTYIQTLVGGAGNFFIAVPAAWNQWVNGGKYWISSDSGANWTEHTITGAPVGITIGHIAANPAGEFVLAATNLDYLISVFADGTLLYASSASTDSGFAGVAYLGAAGWRAVTRLHGHVVAGFGSGDWSLISTLPVVPANAGAQNSDSTGNYYGNALASDGGRGLLAMTCSDTYGSVGCAYSQDHGLTWQHDELSHICQTGAGGGRTVSVSYGDGEFLAIVVEPDVSNTSQNHFSIWQTSRL